LVRLLKEIFRHDLNVAKTKLPLKRQCKKNDFFYSSGKIMFVMRTVHPQNVV